MWIFDPSFTHPIVNGHLAFQIGALANSVKHRFYTESWFEEGVLDIQVKKRKQFVANNRNKGTFHRFLCSPWKLLPGLESTMEGRDKERESWAQNDLQFPLPPVFASPRQLQAGPAPLASISSFSKHLLCIHMDLFRSSVMDALWSGQQTKRKAHSQPVQLKVLQRGAWVA